MNSKFFLTFLTKNTYFVETGSKGIGLYYLYYLPCTHTLPFPPPAPMHGLGLEKNVKSEFLKVS
jgi:hypothetical protein